MSMEEEQTPKHSPRRPRNGKQSHANLLVILLALVFCVAVACTAAYLVARNSQPAAAGTPGLVAEGNVKTGTINDPAGGQEALNEVVREGMLSFSINATPSMKDGKSEINLLIENPPNNGTRFTVTICREDTGEEIYRSGYLDPEQYIDNTHLDVELPEGEYPCIAYFDSYRIKDSSYIGRAAAQITVYVLD